MITTTFRGKEVNIKEQLTLMESLSFVKSIVNNIVDTDDGTFEPMFFDVSLISEFLNTYTDIKDVDIDEVYTNLDEYKNFRDSVIYDMDEFDTAQYNSLINTIDQEIEFKKQQIIHKQNSAMDEMFITFNNLLTTLNSKVEQIDTKKLEKAIKKLNIPNLIKEYQKSGIGESVRDDAIQDQAKTIIKLNKVIEELKAKSE